MLANLTVKWTLVATVLFIIGLVLAVITLKKYKKEKEELGDEIQMKGHIIRIVAVFALFILSQVCIILGR